MTAQFPHRTGPTINAAAKSQGRKWVVSHPTRNLPHCSDLTTTTSRTKLVFSEAFPASSSNRATRVCPPAPIVIERLLPAPGERERVESTGSSVSFTAVSEERLREAVRLAKRDLRRRRLESLTASPVKPSQDASVHETSDAELLEELTASPKNNARFTTSSPKNNSTRYGFKLSATKPRNRPIFPMPRIGRSPPTRDPGPRQFQGCRKVPLSQEVGKLQHELQVYIQKLEALSNRGGGIEEPLEPEELNKLDMRMQKQAGRSARVIYVLQQQVKEIQEDIERFQRQKVWDSKKSTTVNRLAAAHRGTLRVLQFVVNQLSDLSHSKVPPYYKELGKLIRMLSLCSAKVEAELNLKTADILQKLETLDSALHKQALLERMHAQAQPPNRNSPPRGTSPSSAPKGPSTSTVRATHKPANPKRAIRGKRMASQKPKSASHQLMNRREMLRAGLQSLALRELQGQPQTNTTCSKGRAPPSGRSKAGITTKVLAPRPDIFFEDLNNVRTVSTAFIYKYVCIFCCCGEIPCRKPVFQQPTVSSQLRMNQLPQKEHSVPWIPTSPHSPPPQQSPQRRPEPRCLFSPSKPSSSPPKQVVDAGLGPEPALTSQKKTQAQNEALRNAWLDKMTTQRLTELNQLSREEAQRIASLRSEVVSPTRWAERAEQEARERIQPLLDEAKSMGLFILLFELIGESRTRINPSRRTGRSHEAAERLSEALLEELLEDTARAAWAVETDRQFEGMAQSRLQAPTLESMLLRMEEIQRDQEEVRRRFASITYSDPLWDRPDKGLQCHAPPSRASSPQPIRLTKPVWRQSSTADVILEKPVEIRHGVVFESAPSDEASQDEQQPTCNGAFPVPAERAGGTVLSVPGGMLGNIRQYREEFEAYLRAVTHEDVGSFNPWAVADCLAEELLSEAVADVAAEFQDVVEEYAEAVFTSEFLKPTQSPPASAASSLAQ
ncbi:LOW QUALITY PROTEIN: protein moonraker [Spinachia spinachia]